MTASGTTATKPTPSNSTVAELRAVSKSYGAVRALEDVNLEIRAGEVVALLGPNGAGKTTAVSLLLGLMRPTAGEVRLFGGNPQDAAVRTRVGAMLQVSGVPQTLKVREHVDLFRSYYPNPLGAAETLKLASLAEVANRPYGKLSGGQQQLHLALALCGNPDLVFLIFQPVFDPERGLLDLVVVGLMLAIFLPVYFWTFGQCGPKVLWGVAVMALLSRWACGSTRAQACF